MVADRDAAHRAHSSTLLEHFFRTLLIGYAHFETQNIQTVKIIFKL